MNSLDEIDRALQDGAIINSDSSSFRDRNSKVALVDVVIAFTWKKVPRTSTKYHVSLTEVV